MTLLPIRTVPPATDLVTLAEAKAHCNVDHNGDDTLLTVMIAAAQSHTEAQSDRPAISQTWKINLDTWPDYRIRLPLSPVSAIASITYYDAANALQTLASSNYGLFEDSTSPYAGWTSTAALPALFAREDAIEVLFVAGYGAAAAVPADLRLAALLLIGHWYAHRETVSLGELATEVPMAFKALIGARRRMSV